MRLGKLILQTCSVIIALALVAGVYVLYRNYQVESYRSALIEFDSGYLPAIVDFFSAAPSMTCVHAKSNFDAAVTGEYYFHNGQTRVDQVFVNAEWLSTHHIVNNTGQYYWSDEDDFILFVPIDADIDLSDDESLPPSIFNETVCQVWWFPDDRIFKLPSNKPLIQFDEL